MTVITMSRQFGSYGDDIAKKVCEILDYRYFDKALMLQAATAAGLSEQEIVDYSEDNYKVRNFLNRLFGGPQTVAQVSVWKEDQQGNRFHETLDLSEASALALIQRAIEYAHEIGNVVIVGRGGQALLQDLADVLHVRIEAPLENRLERVRGQVPPDEGRLDQRRSAQDLIQEKDAASADYLQHYYNVRWDDLNLYHIVINTGKMSVEQAADLIVRLAEQIHPEPELI